MALQLSALDPRNFRPIATPDPSKRFQTIMEARQMLADEAANAQTAELRGLQIQGEKTKLSREEETYQKAAKIQQVFEQTGGDLEKALPLIMQIDSYFGMAMKGEAEKQRIASAKEQREIEAAELNKAKIAADATDRQMQRLADITKEGNAAMQPKAVGGSIYRPLEGDFLTPPQNQAERNIDPNSPEGIKARLEFERLRPRDATVSSEPLEAILGPDGKAVLVPRSQAAGKQPAPSSQSRPPSEGERTALRFYERMKSAADDLAKYEPEIAKLGLGGQTMLKYAPNFLQTEAGQLYQQAQRAFTEARLRKDSGAAIPEQEFANDRRMYFVQPGDTPKAMEQKARSRATALDAIRRSAARAYEETYGESPNVPAAGGSVRFTSSDGQTLEVPADKWPEVLRRDPGAKRAN